MTGNPIITQQTSIKQYQSIVKHFGVSIADQKYLNRKVNNINNIVSIKYTHVSGFKNIGMALKYYYPQWPNDLIEIISKCLQFKPFKRKPTKLLLNKLYFVNGNFLKEFTKKLKNKVT